jgi:predicted ATPase
MQLTSAQITNYKCIEDSSEFTMDRVTCLVGKNESGKTAILEALYKLNPDIGDRRFTALTEYPRSQWSVYRERTTAAPAAVVRTKWQLEASDLEALAGLLGPNALTSQTVVIEKGYDNQLKWKLDVNEHEVVEYYVKGSSRYKGEVAELCRAGTIQELAASLQDTQSPSEAKAALAQRLAEQFPDNDVVAAAEQVLSQRLPVFLYFADYDKLPGKVSIDALLGASAQGRTDKGNRVFLSLLELAGTDAKTISEIGRSEELIAELEAVSNRITDEIFTYWSQNSHLRVQCTVDHSRSADPPPFNSGWVFQTRILNTRHNNTVNFDERSTGFVWFFSFLVWFSQMQKLHGGKLIILLDEPGLGLHAKAQADLLRYIDERLAPHYQVLYTTHSPFMVDADNLPRVRTVEDVVVHSKAEGTKVNGEIYGTDADTIFPLQAALGYGITQTLFVGKHVLLVEGPSDLLYLEWFSRQLQERGRTALDRRWVITPVGGMDKMHSFVALFGGNKLHVALLIDFASGARSKVRGLQDSPLIRPDHVLTAEKYAKQPEADVEDVLGHHFYCALVNRCYSLKGSDLLADQTSDASGRVIKEVEDHFRTMATDAPKFDHCAPALYLAEHTDVLQALPDLDAALDRFESLFVDLNKLLAD